jgi:hypothetical protein
VSVSKTVRIGASTVSAGFGTALLVMVAAARIRPEFRRPEQSGAGGAAGTAVLTALAASGRPRGSQ